MNLEPSLYKVEAGPFNKVDPFIPTSKSYANRLLVLASLYDGPVTIKKLSESTDVLTMIECLKQVGLKMSGDLNELIITNSFPACETEAFEEVHLNTGDGGTTNRFLMALVSLGKLRYFFHPTGKMPTRPVDQFIKELSQLEVTIKKEENAWLSINGPLNIRDNEIKIDCSKSTQFATALQMVISPFGKEVKPDNMHSSAKYFEITNNLCRRFHKGEREFCVPLDFSSFSYPVALAACTGKIIINEFTGIDILQADSELVKILKKMGAQIIEKGSCISIEKNKLYAITLDCSSFPDLVPTLAFICSYAAGRSYLNKVNVLRHKESDRIDELLKILKAFKVKCSYDEIEDVLIIEGRESIEQFVDIETAKDHRMVMVAYLFMRSNGGGNIHHLSHVNKSYPNFFETME